MLDNANEDYEQFERDRTQFEEYYNQRAIETGLPSWLVLLFDIISVADCGLNQGNSSKEVMLSITAQGVTLGASNGPDPSDLLVLETITVTAASLFLLNLAATYYQSHYTQSSSIAIPHPGVSNYQVAKNKADALDLIEAAVAVLATREAGVQILYRGTTFDQAVTEQDNHAARYDKPGAYNRLWTFPHSTTSIAEAAFYAVESTIINKSHMGAISIYAMPQIIFDANSGGQSAPIWRRFGREAGIGELMDPHLIGPYVIAIPLNALREMK